MRTWFYPNEYIPCIKRAQKDAKTLNPFKRKKAKERIKDLEEMLYFRYPEVKGMSEEARNAYLEEQTRRMKWSLGIN